MFNVQDLPVSGLVSWAVKGGFLIGLAVYLLFAVVIVRQISLMSETVNTNQEDKLKLVAYLHLGLVFLLMVIVLVVL